MQLLGSLASGILITLVMITLCQIRYKILNTIFTCNLFLFKGVTHAGISEIFTRNFMAQTRHIANGNFESRYNQLRDLRGRVA